MLKNLIIIMLVAVAGILVFAYDNQVSYQTCFGSYSQKESPCGKYIATGMLKATGGILGSIHKERYVFAIYTSKDKRKLTEIEARLQHDWKIWIEKAKNHSLIQWENNSTSATYQFGNREFTLYVPQPEESTPTTLPQEMK